MKYQKIKHHYKTVDPIIYQAMQGLNFDEWLVKWSQAMSGDDYFVALARSIVGQQLSGKAAVTIYGRFTTLFPKKRPDAKKLLKLKDQQLRDVGMSWGKVSYVKDLANKHLSGEINLMNLNQLTNDEVIAQLTKVKGIGPWTGEMFLMFTLRREDVFSFGDLGLKRGIEKLYKLDNPTVKQITKIITPWSPYKTYGSIALWHSLDN